MLEQDFLRELEYKACEIVREAGRFISDQFGKVEDTDIHIKDLNSLVSYVDIETEKKLVQGLSDLLPEAGFLTEEETINTSAEKEYTWIIDPLDGTTNYLRRIPVFSISVALRYQDDIIIGIVMDITQNRCFHAIKGGGSKMDGKMINCSDTATLKEAILATGFPYDKTKITSSVSDSLLFFLKNTRGVRRLGSAAIDLAYTAAGIFDGYYEAFLNPWDIAAGALLVQEAGGVVCDFKNQDNYVNRGEIIATNKPLNSDIKTCLKSTGMMY